MTKNSLLLILAVATMSSAVACSKRPVVSGPDGDDKAKAAVEDCIKQGDEAEGDGRLSDAARRGLVGGAASAAAGGGAAAAGNALGGNYDVGGSVGMSAAAGVAGNVALGLADRDVDPAYAEFVEKCLSKKGYKTTRWE